MTGTRERERPLTGPTVPRAASSATLFALGLALGIVALGAPRSAAAQAPLRRIAVTHYALSIDLPDSGADITGRATLTVHRTAAVDTLPLDLVALTVDSVLVDGRPVSFQRTDSALRVPLLSYRPATESHVTVRYHGVVTDGLIIRTDAKGRWTAFGDDWPQRARDWIPSIDRPSDKATVTWTVRAPNDRMVVGNGELEEVTPLPVAAGAVPRTLTRWRESRPIPTYTMVIAAAPLTYVDLGPTACGESVFPGCVRQSVYAEPELRSYLPGPFAQAPAIVDYFARLVAPFPFERLAHVQSSTRFGGMENATEIFYADQSFQHRAVHVSTVAHETAHQWFGDAVTPERFSQLWLSEGFATYWALLWTEHSQGEAAFRAGLDTTRAQIVASPVAASRPVVDTAQTNFLRLLDVNSYQKGAWVLHMLRGLVGDSAFFRGIRAYYTAHRYGNVRSRDLQRAMERSAGRPLGWFFDEWLRRPGFAELTTAWHYDARTRRVTLDVEQGTRFPPYRAPLTVSVRDAAGHVHRTTLTLRALRAQRLTLPFPLDAAPRAVVLDPDVQLLATFRSR